MGAPKLQTEKRFWAGALRFADDEDKNCGGLVGIGRDGVWEPNDDYFGPPAALTAALAASRCVIIRADSARLGTDDVGKPQFATTSLEAQPAGTPVVTETSTEADPDQATSIGAAGDCFAHVVLPNDGAGVDGADAEFLLDSTTMTPLINVEDIRFRAPGERPVAIPVGFNPSRRVARGRGEVPTITLVGKYAGWEEDLPLILGRKGVTICCEVIVEGVIYERQWYFGCILALTEGPTRGYDDSPSMITAEGMYLMTCVEEIEEAGS